MYKIKINNNEYKPWHIYNIKFKKNNNLNVTFNNFKFGYQSNNSSGVILVITRIQQKCCFFLHSS